ncbi:MAG: Fe-S cluster assembly sulfur transfer protein SufU [Deinococcota bacterium]
MSLLDSLYKELILEHYKRPRNRGELLHASIRQEGLNPSCGDELELFLLIEDGVITDIRFTGAGCAISQSSASMMTEAINGQRLEDALERAKEFKAMIHGDPPADSLGDLKVLSGIAKLPARVKCATLAWVTLEQAVHTFTNSASP